MDGSWSLHLQCRCVNRMGRDARCDPSMHALTAGKLSQERWDLEELGKANPSRLISKPNVQLGGGRGMNDGDRTTGTERLASLVDADAMWITR
jgi:hypothetical protein